MLYLQREYQPFADIAKLPVSQATQMLELENKKLGRLIDQIKLTIPAERNQLDEHIEALEAEAAELNAVNYSTVKK